MKIAKKPRKTNGFSLVFEVLDRVWNSKNQKKSITIGLDRLREAENEIKTGQGSLRKRKMKQRKGFQRKKEAL